MEKEAETEDTYVRNQTLFLKNNNEWSDWRKNSLDLELKKRFIKIKDKKKVVEDITITSELTYLDFLKYIGELTYEIFCGGNDTLIFTVSSAVKYIHKKIEEEMEKGYRGQKKIEKISEQKYIIDNQSVKYNIDALNRKLNKILPESRFFERIGNDYRLLIYAIDAPNVPDGKGGKISLVPHENTLKQHIGAIIQLDKKLKKLLDKDMTHIQTLEKYLKKDMIKDPKYFRKIGPLWADFEAGYVTKRDEADKIIRFFEKERFQLLIGDAASGKSTIASIIGYKLYKEGWKVYYLKPEIVQSSSRKELQNDIDSLCINNKKSLIIIEDLHRNALKVVELLEYIENSKTRFLIITRKSFKTYLKSEKISFIEELCKEIKLEDKELDKIAGEIIETFKQNQKDERADELALFTLDDKNKIIREAKKNLWVLAYLLEAWKPNIGINFNLVYKKVRRDIKDLIIEFRNKYEIRGVPETLFSIAPFSVFEVGVCKSFLNENYSTSKINLKTIEKLIEYGEIIENKEGYYLIPHSTLAQLYMETDLFIKGEKKRSDLLYGIVRNQSETGPSGELDEYPTKTLHKYIQWKPKNFGEIFLNIHNFEMYESVDEERAIWPWERIRYRGEYYWNYRIIPCLLENKNTLNALKKVMKESNNLQEINAFLSAGWRRFDNRCKNELLEICDGINEHDWVRRIENSHGEEIIDFLNIMFGLKFIEEKYRFLKPLFNKLNLSILQSKLKKCPLSKVTRFIQLIYWIDKSLLSHFKDVILEKIKTVDSVNEEESLDEIHSMFSYLNCTEPGAKLLREIKKEMEPELVLSLFEKEKDL